MLSTEAAILRTRRDLVLGLALKALLGASLLGCLLIAVEPVRLTLLLTIGAVWVALNFTSARGSRLAAASPSLIAAGRLDEAEQQIDQAIRAFSLFRVAKLQPLHYLALLRHAQRRWQESALLCRTLLQQRAGAGRTISNGTRLILTDALLEMGDLVGAYETLARLYHERLSLTESLNLLLVQLDYSSRIGAFQDMAQQMLAKVQLAELMPTEAAARAQALLGLAARQVGREDWALWLRRRAELLVDADQLTSERPILKALFSAEDPLPATS